MKKDEVIFDLQGFPNDTQMEGARSVFQKIEQTVRKGNYEKCACVLAHLDSEDSPRTSVFMCGSPKITHNLLFETLVTSIKQGVYEGKENDIILLNALRLLLRVNVNQLHLADERKLVLQKAIADIGVIAITR